MSHDRRPRLGLVMGDPTGIGPEVLAKVLADPQTFQRCRPVVIGDAVTLSWSPEATFAIDLPREETDEGTDHS